MSITIVVQSFHCHRTSTILEHWVPLPAPGPPSTNTTCGFIISGTWYSKLDTLLDTKPTKRENINRPLPASDVNQNWPMRAWQRKKRRVKREHFRCWCRKPMGVRVYRDANTFQRPLALVIFFYAEPGWRLSLNYSISTTAKQGYPRLQDALILN